MKAKTIKINVYLALINTKKQSRWKLLDGLRKEKY